MSGNKPVPSSLHPPLKEQIGVCSETHQEKITAERINAFCRAVGFPVSTVAPPTFLTVFRRGEFDLLQKLGLSLSSALHADQRYEYIEPIQPDDLIQFENQVSQVLEKNSTKQNMQFLTLETRIQRVTDNRVVLVAKAVSTLVFREILEQA